MIPHSSLASFSEDALPFKKIFDFLPQMALILSPELIILAANDAYLRETLTVKEHLIGRPLFEVFPDKGEPIENNIIRQLIASLHQVLQTKLPHQMPVQRYNIPDPTAPGSVQERYWSSSNTPLLNEKGEIICLIHVVTNVTESAKAECMFQASQFKEQQALAEAEYHRKRMERFLMEIPAGICSFAGPELVYDFVNPRYQQQLFPGRDLLGKPLFEAVPEVEGTPIAQVLEQVLKTGETIEGKEMHIPLSPYEGAPLQDHYFNFIQQARYDEQGKIEGILTFAYDITELVEARKKVEQSEQALQALNEELTAANEGLRTANEQLSQTQQALQELNLELEERVARRTRELQLANAEVENQRKRLHTLFMEAPTPIVILDGPNLVYELVSPAYQRIFPGRELLGKPLLEALPELAQTPIPDILKRVYRTGETFVGQELPLMLARKEGQPLEEIYWTFTCQARHNVRGEVEGVLVFAYEVTDQIQARQQVERSRELLQMALKAGRMGTWHLDLQNDTSERSLQHDQIFGYSTLQAEWGYKQFMTHVLAQDREAVDLGFQQAMHTGSLYMECRIKRYDEELRWVEIRGEVFYGYIGEPLRMAGVITDITERKGREEELRKMADRLTAANEELNLAIEQLTRVNQDLDNFVYTASHDLKAPVLNIEGLLKALERQLGSEALESETVRQIYLLLYDSVARFKATIRDLTEVARISKESSEDVASITLTDILNEVQLDLQPQIAQLDAKLEINLGCPPLHFSKKNLKSLVYNLLSNALKYHAPDRVPLIRIKCQTQETYHVLMVEDNGLGMDMSQKDKIFALFKRLHTHVEGTGIGLYIVKKMIENSGGKIEVESQIGVGSTFKVYFRQ